MRPWGKGWAAATTEGVMVFTRDLGLAFDPTDLGEDVTPAAARAALKSGDARRALLMALGSKGADGNWGRASPYPPHLSAPLTQY